MKTCLTLIGLLSLYSCGSSSDGKYHDRYYGAPYQGPGNYYYYDHHDGHGHHDHEHHEHEHHGGDHGHGGHGGHHGGGGGGHHH